MRTPTRTVRLNSSEAFLILTALITEQGKADTNYAMLSASDTPNVKEMAHYAKMRSEEIGQLIGKVKGLGIVDPDPVSVPA